MPHTTPVGLQTQEPIKCPSSPFSSRPTGGPRCSQSGSGNTRARSVLRLSVLLPIVFFSPIPSAVPGTQLQPIKWRSRGKAGRGAAHSLGALQPSSLPEFVQSLGGSYGKAVVSNALPYFACRGRSPPLAQRWKQPMGQP